LFSALSERLRPVIPGETEADTIWVFMSNRVSILVVDDEPAILQTFGMILRQAGYEVTTAASCQEALPLVRSGKFAVVITDLSMEREDVGFEIVREAQQRKVPPVIVICTGYPNRINSRVALSALRRLLQRRKPGHSTKQK
jgi:CheY-like chemotaxis protein